MTEFKKTKLISSAIALSLLAFVPHMLHPQIPDAPPIRFAALAGQSAMPAQQAQPEVQQPVKAQPGMQPAATPVVPLGPKLTLADAERIAIQHNPNISVARLLVLAEAQVTREARSNELPTAIGSLTAVGAHENSRVTAGLLNNPTVFNRAAGGLTVSQLITDFGRTHNLVLSAQSNAKAQLENERATEQDITLTVDQAFYQALTSQTVLKVAEQTVAERQTTLDQITSLANAKLRSDLDRSFADVQTSQAKLMLLDARSNEQNAMASLNDVLGSEQDKQFDLVDETSANPEPAPQSADALLQSAFAARPDLAALNDNYDAARHFSAAERDLRMPTVSALAAIGGTPVRSDQILSSWYGAAGANINIPVFNGFLFNARAREAKLRANAAGELVRNLRDNIARDVRTAVLNAQNAYQKISVTQGMLNQANLSLDLANARYKIGLSGIVELTQAQLSQTEAQIAFTSARYAYQTSLAELRFQLGQ
jgi:outer membrane protein